MVLRPLPLYCLLAAASAASLESRDVEFLRSRAFIAPTENLEPRMSQFETNGFSTLGTLEAKRLPEFLTSNCSPPGQVPWGNRSASSGNSCGPIPNTGCLRVYDFDVSIADVAPDGVKIPGILINGSFPGPTIEANWGDMIQVNVHNHMPNGTEGVAIHWHGLLQHGTVWEDGVPAVQQCPIPPGMTFQYQFLADMFGTTWYHSHYSAQYAAGLFGALIIYGPHDNAAYDEDLGPILLGDWYHEQYFNLVKQTMAPFPLHCSTPHSSNVLINGKMNYNCSAGPQPNPCGAGQAFNATPYDCTPGAGISKFRFTSGKKYRLRLINAGAQSPIKFSIDNHSFTIFANDFVPIVPYNSSVITLGIGQRSDVVVAATGKPTDAVWMRADVGPNNLPVGCGLNDGTSPIGFAAIYYEKADSSAVPSTTSHVTLDQLQTCLNDNLTLTVPLCSMTPTLPATVQEIVVTLEFNDTDKHHQVFMMNGQSFRGNYNHPVLLQANQGNLTFEKEWNVYNFGTNTSYQLIVYNNAGAGSHPIHMHGHNFWVIDVGYGTYDGKTVVNAKNPQRRDVQLLPPVRVNNVTGLKEQSYIVLQVNADNPGVWPFHCHIAWHVSNGLYINLLERPDEVAKLDIPSTWQDLCNAWDDYSNVNVIDQIDSGLKRLRRM